MKPILSLCYDEQILPAWAEDFEALCAHFSSQWVKRGAGGPFAMGIRVVDDAEGLKMNQEFRQANYVPDVLSFESEDEDAWDEEEGWFYMGDIVIIEPVVLAEAAARGWGADEMGRHLLAHGALHLMGHDHDDKKEQEEMEAAEAEWLAAYGDENPYTRKMD
ncbi:MAG: rRNA maturation RNase YbeY [Alphaproteobacteria bacterium CG_4_10_14_0_8_um_filter_53_9]|nr:MAG: rRNA maturation RNase YbeY [Alphaproteobacteria bacterium CG_4_10_14_0_8_um_filter_53_9]